MKFLDMRDIAIIDAFPVHDCRKTVLNVGCGEGRIDYWLSRIGYRVYATDIKAKIPIEERHWTTPSPLLTFYDSDIFDLSSFPVQSSPIVICSQVLEHLSGYKTALVHLLALTEVRLIITVPYKRSFWHPSHVNIFHEGNVHKFWEICEPYSTSIQRIRTKLEDVEMEQWNYLIVVDKRQNI